MYVTFVVSWAAAAARAPTCAPEHRWQFLTLPSLGDIAATVLVLDWLVRLVRRIPLSVSSSTPRALLSGLLLVAGLVGVVGTFGCVQLEAAWPTLNDSFQAFTGSAWRQRAQLLLFAGFVGACLVRFGKLRA